MRICTAPAEGSGGTLRSLGGKIRDGTRASERSGRLSQEEDHFLKTSFGNWKTLGAFQGYKKAMCPLTRLKIKDPHPGAFGVGRRHCVEKAGVGLAVGPKAGVCPSLASGPQ